jgi:anaerobic selenocysteine-containing dehydrogenase
LANEKKRDTGLESKPLTIKRRTFLKAASALGLSSAVGGGFATLGKGSPVIAADNPDVQTFRSSCAMECLHCNLTAHVIDGKIQKVEASKDFVTKGCLRGLSRVQWINHPDRLKYPMKRVGEKGEGKFEQITWDEALDIIVGKIKETQEKLGNKGLFFLGGSGNMNALTNPTGSAFFDFLGGCTRTVGTLCCAAVTSAMNPMVGFRYVDTRDTIADSKYLLVWGNNPAVTMQGYFKEYETALSRGARMVAVDPRFHETAAKADEWVAVNPGTDTALALGMLNLIIKENLHDESFLLEHTGAPYLVDAQGNLAVSGENKVNLVFDSLSKKIVPHDTPDIKPLLSLKGISDISGYTSVFDLIVEECAQWTPEKVQEETDVPAATVVRLAREYATIKPAMIVQNMTAAQRTEFGTYVTASHIYLAAFTGNYGLAGGGVCDAGGVTQFVQIKPPIKPPKPQPNLPVIQTSMLGELVSNDQPNPIGFWWIMTSSPMTQHPNTNAVKKALKKVPFVVVADNLMTSTALYADLVLPVCSIFEETNLMAGIRNHYIQLMEKAVEPPGEAKSDVWIFTQLAKKFGFGEAFDKPIEQHIETCLEGTGVTLEELKKGPVKPVPTPSIPFKGGKFRTPTGKANLFIQDWKDKNKLSPIVKYYRPVESPKGSPDLFTKYPLMAVHHKTHRSVHSSFSTLSWINEATWDKAHVTLNAADAAERGIMDEDPVVVYNDRGEHKALARVTHGMKKGVIALEDGWWEQQGGSSSYISNDKPEPFSFGQSNNSTLVQVRKEA